MSIGVMLVGARGATASTVLSSVGLASEEDLRSFLVTESSQTDAMSLPALDTFRWGGWDVIDEPWPETIRRHGVLDRDQAERAVPELAKVQVFHGVALASDHPTVAGETRTEISRGQVLDRLRHQIRTFREAVGAEHLVVLDLSAPSRLPSRDLWPTTPEAIVGSLNSGEFTAAAPYYAVAAILEGCAFVDYTASETLEIPGILALARDQGVPLAGRDGSTGQTLLKSVLAQMFSTRRLLIEGWYSTNILGNHDGFVLQDPRFCDVKKRDKTDLLEPILGYPVKDHIVDIRYYRPAGDVKEAWDAIDFRAWLGGRGRLRINWACSDSLLATPAILDLARLMAYSLQRGYSGLQRQYGMFFKAPLGTTERRFIQLANQFVEFVRKETSQCA